MKTAEVELEAPARRELHPVVRPISLAVGAAGAAAYLALVDPRSPGHYPVCPSLLLTGYYCPGCGSLRAINRLLHGDLVGAWDFNLLLVIVTPWLVWRWVRWLLATLGRPVRMRLAPSWAIYALAGAVVAYWVLRNVPALAPYLAP